MPNDSLELDSDIKTLLTKRESIEARYYDSSRETHFILTSLRILKIHETFSRRDIDEIPLRHVTSISSSERRKSLLILCALFFGLVGTAFNIYAKGWFYYGHDMHIVGTIISWAIALLFFIRGARTSIKYTITGAGIDTRHWRIQYGYYFEQGDQLEEIKEFVDKVRRKIALYHE